MCSSALLPQGFLQLQHSLGIAGNPNPLGQFSTIKLSVSFFFFFVLTIYRELSARHWGREEQRRHGGLSPFPIPTAFKSPDILLPSAGWAPHDNMATDWFWGNREGREVGPGVQRPWRGGDVRNADVRMGPGQQVSGVQGPWTPGNNDDPGSQWMNALASFFLRIILRYSLHHFLEDLRQNKKLVIASTNNQFNIHPTFLVLLSLPLFLFLASLNASPKNYLHHPL